MAAHSPSAPVLGLRANRGQFALLVLVNAFVGAMVGIERTVLPLLAKRDFGLASATSALSFLGTFGLVKAVTNLLAGRLGDRVGRKRILIAGWLAGVPVPFLLIWAPSWTWIVVANVFLGINQGLAWSTTVIMKIDLVGPKNRGLAMGFNEFSGYLAVACTALATGWLAQQYGLRPVPFYLGIAVVALGLGISLVAVRDTTPYAKHEARQAATRDHEFNERRVASFGYLSWKQRSLLCANQAGLINNLNDGVAWGLFPVFFAARGASIREIGLLAFVYPAAWGIGQLWTGALSDRWGRRPFIVGGMVLQCLAFLVIANSRTFPVWCIGSLALGVGTALVYPTLLAVVGDTAHPLWRGAAVGVYRFWRDIGYAVGAVVAGMIADALGVPAALIIVGILTGVSGVVAAVGLPETLRTPRRLQPESGTHESTVTRHD